MIDATCQKQIRADRDAALRRCWQGAAAVASPAASGHARAMKLRAYPAGRLSGSTTVPGDKSVSHRALMLAGMAVGESRIGGLLEGADVLATAQALRALGVAIERDAGRPVACSGRGRRRPSRARPAARSRQFRHRRAPAAGPPRRASVHLLHDRRRFAALAPDGPGERAARADGRRVRHPQRRPPAARDHRQQRAAADPLPAAGRVRPGQVRDPSRRPACTRPHHRGRAAGLARPYRAAAAPSRRHGHERAVGGRRPGGRDHRPARALRRGSAGAGLRVVGRFPPGGGGIGRGLVAASGGRRRQPAAHRPAGDLGARWARSCARARSTR